MMVLVTPLDMWHTSISPMLGPSKSWPCSLSPITDSRGDMLPCSSQLHTRSWKSRVTSGKGSLHFKGVMGRQISLLWSCHIPKCLLEPLPPSWYQPESGTNRKDGRSEKAQVLEDIIELLSQTAPKPILPLGVQVRKKKCLSQS